MEIRTTLLLRIMIFILIVILPPTLQPRAAENKNVPLSPGDTAEVTGDYVRVRTGPTLQHRILTKVNRGTKVTVIEKSKEKMKIESMEAYWYKVKLEGKEITGWIYGAFLKKLEKIPTDKAKKTPGIKLTLIPPLTREKIPYRNMGKIKITARNITTGDLNNNGIGEIIFLKETKRETIFTGFEAGDDANDGNKNNKIKEVYNISLRLNGIESTSIYNFNNVPPLITVKNKVSSFIFLYNHENNNFKLLKRINSEKIAIGKYDEEKLYYLSANRNRRRDNDGTITYFLSLTPFLIKNGRIITDRPIKYPSPLPIKKIITIDVDNDKTSEIIAEIGGRNLGGGLVLLKVKNGGITRIQNTGFPTYNDGEFLSMWGVTVKHNKPYLFIYSEEPENAYTANPFMGIIVSGFEECKIKYSTFLPINRMLEDINNYRTIIPVTQTLHSTGEKKIFFYIIDFSPEIKEYTIKRIELQS